MNNQFPLKVLALEFDVSTHSIAPRVRSISPDNVLQDMYKIIGCSLVTCTQIQINGQYFDIWSDDEALFADNIVPMLYINDDLVIFGNLIFAKTDEEGKLVGLTDSEILTLYHFACIQFPKIAGWIDKLKNEKG